MQRGGPGAAARGGPLVDGIGWSGFFVATALAAVPALLLLLRVPDEG